MRSSKAPNWSWNANPFYFPLKLMEITSLYLNFYNNKTGFCKDKLKELSLLLKKAHFRLFSLFKVQSRKLKKVVQMDTAWESFFHWNTYMFTEVGKMVVWPNTLLLLLSFMLVLWFFSVFESRCVFRWKNTPSSFIFLCSKNCRNNARKVESKKLNVIKM